MLIAKKIHGKFRSISILLAVFVVLGCSNDFGTKAMEIINPVPFVPTVEAIYWDTTQILLNDKLGKNKEGFFPTSLKGVINQTGGRKIWFATMSNEDTYLNFSPEDWSSITDDPKTPPVVKATTLAASPNITIDLANSGINIPGSASIIFKPGTFLGPDSNLLRSVSVTISVREASNAEAGKLTIESQDPDPVYNIASVTDVTDAINRTAEKLLTELFSDSDWKINTFATFFDPPAGSGAADVITEADLIPLLTWISDPILDNNPHSYVVSFGPFTGVKDSYPAGSASVQILVSATFPLLPVPGLSAGN
jgi:hypothetical protein